MPMKLNKHAFDVLVQGDIEWLRRQPRTLEREHILQILDDVIKFGFYHRDELPYLATAAKLDGG